MQRYENIYLIGLMGAGKTTIGKQLAKSMQWPFYDSDKAIEESTGVDIPTIFEFEGEAGFRRRERKMLQELTGLKNIVLATGGGAILDEENRQALRANGFIVYLQCSVDRILERTRKDTQRPLLQTENPRECLEKLLVQREVLYRSLADFRIDTGTSQSKFVVKSILRQFRQINRVAC
jgi:shikimate kinase